MKHFSIYYLCLNLCFRFYFPDKRVILNYANELPKQSIMQICEAGSSVNPWCCSLLQRERCCSSSAWIPSSPWALELHHSCVRAWEVRLTFCTPPLPSGFRWMEELCLLHCSPHSPARHKLYPNLVWMSQKKQVLFHMGCFQNIWSDCHGRNIKLLFKCQHCSNTLKTIDTISCKSSSLLAWLVHTRCTSSLDFL